MRTLEEAAEMDGVTQTGHGLNLHFSPIPNWYMKMEIDCPCCDSLIQWDWEWRRGSPPQTTTDITPKLGNPVVDGAELLNYGHRWISVKCNNCHTQLFAENFD